jgi:hypothetical protein
LDEKGEKSMKTRFLTITVVICLFAILLAACGGSQNPPAGSSSQPGAAVTTAPAGSGTDAMAIIQQRLQNHHGIDRILNAHHTREEWNNTLDRMNRYGAGITEDEKKIIIDYLLSRQ